MSLLCKIGIHDWEILNNYILYSGDPLWEQKACLRCGKFHDGKAIYCNKYENKKKMRKEKALLIAKNHGVEIIEDDY